MRIGIYMYMCMYIYVYIYLRMHECMGIAVGSCLLRLHVCSRMLHPAMLMPIADVFMYEYIHTYIYICIHIYMYIYICTYIYT